MTVSPIGAGRYFEITDGCFLAAGGLAGVPGDTNSCPDTPSCTYDVTVQRGDTIVYTGSVMIWHYNHGNPNDSTTSLGRQNTCASEAHPACEGFADQWRDGDIMRIGTTGCGDHAVNKLCNTQFEIISETVDRCETPVVRIDIPNWHPNDGRLNELGGWGQAGGLTFQGDGCEAVVAAPGAEGLTPRVHTDYQGTNSCAGEPVCAGPGGLTNGDGRDLLLSETDGTHVQ